ncbi:MipA/OmpV family protein [Thalassotalea hakodatensis]|uniref:MipA/OmpV family protein n=1 Tax=Thalassotalea hakodatensis TaxID=3030492 RepID=UPI002573843E|nr:MipA/OmpV family protein [Thalassotalea hakodatensis]
MLKYLALLCCFLTYTAIAGCHPESDSCAPVSQWQFSIAVGGGVHTNPLNGGDNIPLVLVPSVSYYSEKLFFDNGLLGYSLVENERWVFSAITQLNQEKAYFTRWHPKNIFVVSMNNAFHGASKEAIDINQVEDRDWALDAGGQLNWFIDQHTGVMAKLLWDVSNVYQGYTGELSVNHRVTLPFIEHSQLSFGLGAQVNSRKLVNYYYGVEQQDSLFTQVTFQGKTSINPVFHVKFTKAISTQWRLSFYWKRKLLDANTANSPLINTSQIDTVFLGMEYAF